MQEPVSLADLNADDFIPLIDTPFAFRLDDGQEHAVRLVEVRPSLHAAGRQRQPFTLLFQGTPGLVFPQHIYPLTHPALGTLDIFLVPVGATPDETTYEAVFN